MPTDFGHGGLTIFDEVNIVAQETTSVWDEGESTRMDFCWTVGSGNHIIQMIGADDCCDGTTKWTFQVNDGEWEDWTTANFDKYMNETETPDPYDPAECHNCFSIDPFPLLEA